LPSEFPILETHFAYGTLISEIPFVYGTTISESSKIIKDNSGISNNVGVQEDKCRDAGR